MHNFQDTTFIKNKDNNRYRKILARHDGLFEMSHSWNKGEHDKKNPKGLTCMQQHAFSYTLDEMLAYYEPCTTLEATGEEEKWRPKDGQGVYWIDSIGNSYWSIWHEDKDKIFALKLGLVFRTEVERNAKLNEINER